jgi:hypothetical protein
VNAYAKCKQVNRSSDKSIVRVMELLLLSVTVVARGGDGCLSTLSSVVAEVAAELQLKMGAAIVARSCLCPVSSYLISHDTLLLFIIIVHLVYIYVSSVW